MSGGAGSACSSERTIKIESLVTDSVTEEGVSETVDLTANAVDKTAITSFVLPTGALIIRVTVTGTGYSNGIFVLVRKDPSVDGVIHDLSILDGDDGERVGFVWDGAAGPSIQHNALRTGTSIGALDEEITYKITLDTTA
jgi:hypothetical protein